MPYTNGSMSAKAVKQLLLLVLTVLALFPLYFMLATAFKSKEEYVLNRFGLPKSWTLLNFREVFGEGTFVVWFKNSVVLTAGSLVFSLFIAVLAAYALAKFRFPGKGLILNVVVALMVLPPVIMVIPLFRMMASLSLINSYTGVIIIYTGLILPFSIFLLTNFFRSVPNEVIESAQIDGCGTLAILFRMIMPLSLPAFVTLLVVNALWVWNELLVSVIFMQRDAMKTLMVGLTAFKSRYNLNIPVTMAGLIVSTLPIALLYISAQKAFIEGLTAGATKG